MFKAKDKMSEPGVPITTPINQVVTQGIYSSTHFNSSTVASSGNDAVPGRVTSGGVGFSNSTTAGSKEATGQKGENDEVTGEEFTAEQIAMGREKFMMENLPESPYYSYHTRPLSSGVGQTEQKYYNSRELGRGMNMSDIRNGYYYGEAESDLFTWGLNAQEPNIMKKEVEENEYEDVRDV